MQAPLRQTGILGRGPYGDLLTGASFAAIAVGLLFVVLGIAIGDSTIAKVSLLLLPLGAIGLADYYAEKGEHARLRIRGARLRRVTTTRAAHPADVRPLSCWLSAGWR